MTTTHPALDCIEVNPAGPAKNSIIWLHGLGADAHDFASIATELHLPATLGMRFVFPHAPIRPVTLNQGQAMRAWFDIAEINHTSAIDTTGIANMVTKLSALIAKEEARGITSDHILLAGFSQGAAMALIMGLTYPKPLGGIIALSGYLPPTSDLIHNTPKANRRTPIFMAHGTEDAIVPYALGEGTHLALQQAGCPVAWHSYPMPHSVCTKEVTDIRQWIINQK